MMNEKEVKKFYNSTAWKIKRLEILNRDRHECQDCISRIKNANRNGILLNGSDRKIRRAEEVHHIKELKEYPELKLCDDNLISLCTICHNIRHGRYMHGTYRKQNKKKVSEELW